MKTLLTILIALFSINLSYSQAVGGRGNGQSSPSETKASEVNAGGFSGDVSLFAGTYNTNYALGTVSTPSGISFTANMSYSSTFSSGDNPPHVSGVPYGEGWNVDIPSISVKTEDFNKYTPSELSLMGPSPVQYSDRDPTPLFNIDENGNENCEDAQAEGEIFWFSPNVSIPGVFSGRMVFKYKDGGDYVFVPAKFERYVEARYQPGLDNSWEIILDDGTVYEMRPAVYSYRNAPNQRIQPDCIADPEDEIGNVFAEAVYEPKLEVLSWYCEKIHNPNLVGNIRFRYNSFGCFNYFQEYEVAEMLCARTNFYNNGGVGRVVPIFNVCKDLILTSIEASGTERLVFDYSSISTAGGDNMLDLTDPMVERVDSMYAKKAVYQSNDFNQVNNLWKRYYHAKADPVQNHFGNVNMASPSNPYLINYSNEPHLIREPDNSSSFTFDHAFLESPRLNPTDFDIVSGDIYEIRTTISAPSSNIGKGALFDINLASGNYVDGFSTLGGTNDFELINSKCYNESRGQPIFTTFNQGIKWSKNINNTGLVNCTGSQWIESSNFFLMPNIPDSYEGFNIQVGPANADIRYTTPPSHVNVPENSEINHRNTYYNTNYPNSNGVEDLDYNQGNSCYDLGCSVCRQLAVPTLFINY